MRTTPAEIGARKGGQPIVCLTAYTAPVASILDAHVDVLLVGDSVGTVFYGLPSTRGVTLDTMSRHAAAVVHGSARACVVVDLPYGTYEAGPDQALDSARRLLGESGAQAVKLEGGTDRAEVIRRLVEDGIPVMGHVGLLPQRAERREDYRVQGRDAESWNGVLGDAHATVEAGAFALVVESTVEALARAITEAVPIPTIGIGASPACDGQVLVVDDVIGLFRGFTPRFVRRYGDVAGAVDAAVRDFAADVRARRFPTLEHCYDVGSRADGSAGG